jgi:HAD superfamily hydrolase (TIGR01509 family)
MMKKNSIKACIFDLDGTLVDSMWMWHAIDVEYLKKFGSECPDTLQKEIEGMSFTETAQYFKNHFPIPDSIEEIKRDWEDMSLEKYRREVGLKPGAAEFLKSCRAKKIRTGIATSNGKRMVEAVLDSLEIQDYFDTVVTACEVSAGKPSPDIYLRVCEDLQVKPENCLVFEDVPAGILAGKRAGMKVCAVEDPFSAKMMAEKRELADLVIRDYRELMDEEGAYV